MIKNKILFVEDDEQIILYIKDFLEDSGFEIDVYTCVTDALSSIKFNSYDLLLLDLNLPDFNGMDVLSYLSSNKIFIPTIVISAYSDLNIKLQAYKLGACDYLVKPIQLKELEAKIWVHLRNNTNIKNNLSKEKFIIKNNSILFNNEILKLTKIEFEILSILIENKNNTISREILAKTLSSKSDEKTISYHIKNIRKKIKDDSSVPMHLITLYGEGYKLI